METKVFNKELKLIDFENMLDTNLSPEARNFIANQNFKYGDVMEQLGSNYVRFIVFILESRTKIIVNIETMFELYEDENLFDFLPQQYIKKRNWLQGYYAKLYEFERQGKLKILEVKKTFGSFYHDGYTIVVWENLSV